MRFLGVKADGLLEIPVIEQITFTDFLTANQAAAGTSTIAVDVGIGLVAGTWGIEFVLKWNSPDSVNTSFSIDYSGTFTGGSSTWDALRVAGATAHLELQSFNTLVGTSGANPQLIKGQGILVATGSGTLGMSVDRASSGTTTLAKGCLIKATLQP